jgi:hypothetical protein
VVGSGSAGGRGGGGGGGGGRPGGGRPGGRPGGGKRERPERVDRDDLKRASSEAKFNPFADFFKPGDEGK